MQYVLRTWGLIRKITPIFNIAQELKKRCSVICSIWILTGVNRLNYCPKLSGKCAVGKRTNGSANYVTMKVCGVPFGVECGIIC